jgi:hypothetical protein
MTFFLGCNNVIPTTNTDGTVTDTVTAATLAADGSQVPLPTGAISSAEILIDVQGPQTSRTSPSTARSETPLPARAAAFAACKKGGWKT